MKALPITFAVFAIGASILVGYLVTRFGVQLFGVVLVLWLAWRGRRHVRRAARQHDRGES